jgi:hypothetical protein
LGNLRNDLLDRCLDITLVTNSLLSNRSHRSIETEGERERERELKNAKLN